METAPWFLNRSEPVLLFRVARHPTQAQPKLPFFNLAETETDSRLRPQAFLCQNLSQLIIFICFLSTIMENSCFRCMLKNRQLVFIYVFLQRVVFYKINIL